MQAHCLNINNLEHKLHVIHGSLSISLEKNAIKYSDKCNLNTWNIYQNKNTITTYGIVLTMQNSAAFSRVGAC